MGGLRSRSGPAGPPWYRTWVEAWFRALERRGRSPKTLRTYGWVLRDFGRFLEAEQLAGPDDLGPGLLQAWQDQLVVRLPAAHSRATAASAVRGLLRWTARQGMGASPGLWEYVDPVEVPEDLPRALEPEDLRLILAHYGPGPRSLERARDRALFWFLMTTTARISEALRLDVDQALGERIIVRQKGGGEHRLVMSARARVWLVEYLRIRGRDNQRALWIRIGVRGRHRMREGDANRVWAELADQLGIPRFTNHALRHTGVTELGDLGATDDDLVKQAGWKSSSMVARYRKVRVARRQLLVDQLDELLPEVVAAPASRGRRRPTMRIMGRAR